jgi:hypothetical protein
MSEDRIHNACPLCLEPLTATYGGRRKTVLDVPGSKKIKFYRCEPCGCVVDVNDWDRAVGFGTEGTMNVTWTRRTTS